MRCTPNIGSKKTLAGYGLLLIDMKKDLSILTLAHETQVIATDYWKPYEHFIPAEKHIQSKAETWTVEGYNSLY